MKKSGIIIAALVAAMGLMIFAAPAEFIKVVVILLGIVSIINGIINIATVSSLLNDSFFKKDILIRGWSSIIIGILAVALPLAIAATMWVVMLYVLAIYLILSAAMELFAVSRLHKASVASKQYLIEAIISIFVAVLLFVIPGEIGIILVRIIGVAFMVFGAVLVVYYIKAAPIVIEPDSVVDDPEMNSDTSSEKK